MSFERFLAISRPMGWLCFRSLFVFSRKDKLFNMLKIFLFEIIHQKEVFIYIPNFSKKKIIFFYPKFFYYPKFSIEEKISATNFSLIIFFYTKFNFFYHKLIFLIFSNSNLFLFLCAAAERAW